VPKPPRGYWAKVQAGAIQKKPPLPAFREHIDKALYSSSGRKFHRSFIRLTVGQMELLKKALIMLSDAGIDNSDIQLTHEGIASIDQDLAAQILLLIQHQYESWFKRRELSVPQLEGIRKRAANLSSKLLPKAKDQVLLLYRDSLTDSDYEKQQGFMIRVSPSMVQLVANMFSVVKDNKLVYVVKAISRTDYSSLPTERPAYHFSTKTTCELCVSEHDLWLQCERDGDWSREEFRTQKVALRDIVPVDLIEQGERELPGSVLGKSIKPYITRLKALQEAEQVIDALSQSLYRIDNAVPDEELAMFDRLWVGDQAGPLSSARALMNDMDYYLESWEEALEQVKSEICCDALGIEIGDIIMSSTGGKVSRIKLERASLYVNDESQVHFHLNGRRYRKDGILGKRDDFIMIDAGKV